MPLRTFAVIIFLSSSLWASNSAGVADGSDWRQYSQPYKIGWIDGFVSAMSDAQIGTAMLCAFELKLKLESAEGKACIAEAQKFQLREDKVRPIP